MLSTLQRDADHAPQGNDLTFEIIFFSSGWQLPVQPALNARRPTLLSISFC
jgi:hypothetical protein